MSIARDLSAWAARLRPDEEDLALAERSLLDTVAVAVAARAEPVVRAARELPEAARWTVAGHALDFDDLHMGSTGHISAVCVPTALATGGGARAYLAAAGVMARLGEVLGWPHYTAGWHATCTAGAPAAAAGAGVALGLDAGRLAVAMALAVPAAGGVQRAFGTDGKSLQVGFAVDAGIRAARLAAAGATADVGAVGQWLALVGGDPSRLRLDGPAVPGGLAVKLFPCCYALQRPIDALAGLRVPAEKVTRIVLRTPRSAVTPLIHHDPVTGLEGKFSIEYAAAATLLDEYPGLASFTDEAVRRAAARRLVRLVELRLSDGGDGLLAGELAAEVHAGDEVFHTRSRHPPGSPERPPEPSDLRRKVEDCLCGTATAPDDIAWSSAADVLRAHL